MLSPKFTLSSFMTAALFITSACCGKNPSAPPATQMVRDESRPKIIRHLSRQPKWVYQLPKQEMIFKIKKYNLCKDFDRYRVDFYKFKSEIPSYTGVITDISGSRATINWRRIEISISNGYKISGRFTRGPETDARVFPPTSRSYPMYVYDRSIELKAASDDVFYEVGGSLLDPISEIEENRRETQDARALSEILSPLFFLYLTEYEPGNPGNLNSISAADFRTQVSTLGFDFHYYINPSKLVDMSSPRAIKNPTPLDQMLSSLAIAELDGEGYAFKFEKSKPEILAVILNQWSDAAYLSCKN